MSNEMPSKHESYGMLQINRVSGGPSHLFGSSIAHGNKITLSVRTAKVMRDLNRDWYHDTGTIVEVDMSYTQFAEAITSMNTTGVPVTIRYVDGRRMEPCPFVDKRKQFEGEFAGKLRRIASHLDALQNLAEGLTQTKAPNKDQKEAILAEVKRVRQEIGDNLPFTYTQFNEQMDKTVLEAKGEFEALVSHTIHSLGLQALQAEDFKLLEASATTDAT